MSLDAVPITFLWQKNDGQIAGVEIGQIEKDMLTKPRYFHVNSWERDMMSDLFAVSHAAFMVALQKAIS